MALPKRGVRPTASQFVDWCLNLVKTRRGIDVDGRMGFQCWDLPAYLTRYHFGGWVLNGNAEAFGYARLPSYLKRYRNTVSFIPKPGDFAVWQGGPFSAYGHVAIVVRATQNSFVSVDQNWVNPSQYQTGPPTLENHNYNYVTYFIRPDYAPEPKPAPTKPDDPKPTPSPSIPKVDDANKNKENGNKPTWIDVTKITYSVIDEDVTDIDTIYHYVVEGKKRNGKPTGVTIRNNNSMQSVRDVYTNRRKYIKDEDYPHYYVDSNRIWSPRHPDYLVPGEGNNIVYEVCEDFSASDVEFQYNEYMAMAFALDSIKEYGIKLDKNNLKVDKEAWRSVLEHASWDMIGKGFPTDDIYQKAAEKLITLGKTKNLEVLKSKYTTQKFRIKSTSTSATKNNKAVIDDTKPNAPSTSTPKSVSKPQPKITKEKSGYTFTQALNLQMSRGMPQKSYNWGWGNASRADTSNYMNPTKIWNNSTQRYQMLNLGKYQGIPVSKLNQILQGKGTLSGQGKAFADGCKKYNINEIYLIAHAFLESGYGTSNFASGRYGAYNYFGIAAYDNNPNYAMTFAKNQGWTTPSKAIMGGAKFVRGDYINKGQNTLYRMRWNPKAPATHQYATAIEWCSHQATTIKQYYDKIGFKGEFFIYDSYR